MKQSPAYLRFLGNLDFTVRAFVREADPRIENNTLLLAFPAKAAFHYQSCQKYLNEVQMAAQKELDVREVKPMLIEEES
ncbi:hypothetical protein ECD58_03155 [Acinetobacter pittii]|uniref:hypothetical protein n=1 Tax=Acinetobacter pittii TaxID=48296 RepID=UPI00227C317B|nr:hypothetical protein [Acinetobacter pittii]MCY3403098.1 hypothetical protein [Acinetobacter pittii]